MKESDDPCWPTLFPADEIPGMIKDVLDACIHLTRPAKGEKRPEEAISRQVYQKLCRMPAYRRGPLEPHFESWLPDLDGRADIRFSCGKGIDTYFVFEAKRLFVTYPRGRKDSLVKEYVREGMMRFVTGKYAPFQCSSAMLGYVHDAEVAAARSAVTTEISNNADSLLLVRGLAVDAVDRQFDDSVHLLEPNRSFVIYHLLVAIPLE
jgi:hypothetical protein